ncbi:lysozyme inhibitor LprI family protein [Luteimonas sp. Y-2-2-4F]|nr:lysozyme inhibitor LprI family protein [Luteimonas sp. Y-2-2-4F]MCD9031772.1 lysozyme inhibitor LprI family protein [Luteimonas sp. Y-2-2-4F]
MTKWTLVALSLSCISLSARAEESLYSQRYISCMGSSGGVTSQMLDCIVEEHSRQDARLDEAYRDLAGNLVGDRKEALLAAQRLWVRYRDANCEVYAYPDGGTAAAIHEASCGLEMTARRAKELENLFSV